MNTVDFLQKYRTPVAFVLITAAIMGIYYGSLGNYFFSDDFHWIGRAIIAQDSFGEIFRIEGRDFNPVFLFLLWLLIKIFGVSAELFRHVGIWIFIGMAGLFYYLLHRHFKAHWLISFSAALMFGLNVFISETVLNFSAMVYSLALLAFLAAVVFYLEGKLVPSVIFIAVAFLTKETIILAAIPFVFLIKKKNHRFLVAGVTGGLILLRVILQAGAAAGSYTGFIAPENSPLKLYIILFRSMNLDPYAFHWLIGTAALLMIAATVFVNFKETKNRGILFFFMLFIGYAIFFALLPKLSSRYFLFSSIGYWGVVASFGQYAYMRKNNRKALIAIVIVFLSFSCIINLPKIGGEIGDHRILGDFCRQYIQDKGDEIKRQVELKSKDYSKDSPIRLSLSRDSKLPLANVYAEIVRRENLPKLLPYRDHSIGGVIEPRFLVPLIYFPAQHAIWENQEETGFRFEGVVRFD